MFKLKFTMTAAVLLGSILFSGKAAAATGSIYLTGGSVQKGSAITLSLRIDPGTSVNSVQATVNYDPSQLQFDSSAIGVFSTCTQNSGGGGTVTFSCAMLGSSTSSDSLIANITFTALAGSGSTSLSVTNANAANAGAWTDPSASGASVSFTSPAPAPTPPPSRTYSYSSTSSSNSNAAAAPAEVALPQVSVTLNPIQPEYNTAASVINVTTPVSAYFVYGTNKNDLNLSTTPVTINSSGKLTFTNQNLIPGTQYYYQLIAQINGQTVYAGKVLSFTTKGLTVSVTVLDKNYKPLAGQNVTLHSTPINGVTNDKGTVTFNDVTPGMHELLYSANGGKTYSENVYVNNNVSLGSNNSETSAPQSAAVILAGYKVPKVTPPYLLYLAAVAALVVSAFVLSHLRQLKWMLRRNHLFAAVLAR